MPKSHWALTAVDKVTALRPAIICLAGSSASNYLPGSCGFIELASWVLRCLALEALPPLALNWLKDSLSDSGWRHAGELVPVVDLGF